MKPTEIEVTDLTDEQLLCADEHLWYIFLRPGWDNTLSYLVCDIQTILQLKGYTVERDRVLV